MGRVALFHTHRAASSTDISGKSKKLLHRYERHIFVAGSHRGFAKIQLAANRNTKHMDAGFCATNNQGLKYLLRRETDGMCCMHSVKIIFVKFVECFFEGYIRLLQYTNCVCLRSQYNHLHYYTTFCQHFQECFLFLLVTLGSDRRVIYARKQRFADQK